MAKPYNSSAQNLVYQLEVGVGPAILKGFLYVLFMVLMAFLYVATQYQGFKSPRAMDQAQLARNFSETGRLNTRVIRPGDLHFLESRGKLRTDPESGRMLPGQPDILHAPAYPLILGSVFRIFGTEFPAAEGSRYSPEQWVIIPLNLIFCFFSGLLIYLTGRLLFSPRVAFTSVTVFLLAGQLWEGAVSGTEISFALLCFSFAAWCLVSMLNRNANDRLSTLSMIIYGALGGGSLLLLFLTRYSTLVFIPGYLLALFLGLKKKGWIPAGILVAVVLVGISPWILRNLSVSGSPFGAAPFYAMNENPDNIHMRSLMEVSTEDHTIYRSLAVRTLSATRRAFSFTDIPLGSGIALSLFVVTFFYKFQRVPVKMLRWGLLLSYLLLILAAGIFGQSQLEAAHVMFPLVILYGTAFFYLLLDRMQIPIQIVSLSVISLYVFLQSLPLLVTLMPPKPSSYPPYWAREISLVTRPFESTEVICSDMPWATAWYGGRYSLYLPVTVDQFFQIHEEKLPVSGMYLTMLTRNLSYHSQLFQGNYQSWRPVVELSGFPRGWPLPFTTPLSRGQAILLSDRNRWR